MTLHNEDKELQILLALFQSQIQVFLAATFGFWAACVGFLVGAFQVPEDFSYFEFIRILLAGVSMLCGLIAAWSMQQVSKAMKRLEKLRRKYVW